MVRKILPYNDSKLRCPSVPPMNFIGIDSPLYDSKIIYRLLAYSKKINGCRIWGKHLNAGKYGTLGYKGRDELAHRLMWWLFGGKPLTPGLVLDHIGCDNPSCIEPNHLREVTIGENVLRGTAPAAVNARKSCCDKGLHEFTPENTIWEKGNRRRCKTCVLDRRELMKKERKKLEVLPC